MKKVKCQNCGYEWKTESILAKVTCPSCQLKTLVDLKIEDKKKVKNEKNKIRIPN